MNWDARGRLWIASSSLYPQIEPGQAQDDKILILEDTNGDGKADKTTVFADGLLIPTGIEPGDGGC
jgi:glucose/arabinose dehydrogenase